MDWMGVINLQLPCLRCVPTLPYLMSLALDRENELANMRMEIALKENHYIGTFLCSKNIHDIDCLNLSS